MSEEDGKNNHFQDVREFMDNGKSIFDLSDTSDLSEDLSNRILYGRGSPIKETIGERLMRLMKLSGRPLSVYELCAAYERVFKEERDFKKTCSMLFNMKKQNNSKIEKVKGVQNTYKLKDM